MTVTDDDETLTDSVLKVANNSIFDGRNNKYIRKSY